MWRAGLGAMVMLLLAGTAAEAQWGGSPYGRGGYYRQRRTPSRSGAAAGATTTTTGAVGRSFQSGGARPEIAPLEPKAISFPSQYPVGSIVIDTKGRQLLLDQVGDRGAALSDLGRSRGLHLDRHGDHQPQGRLARLASAR